MAVPSRLPLLLLLLCCGIIAAAAGSDEQAQRHAELTSMNAKRRESFTKWANAMGRGYMEDVEEFERRLAIWSANLEFVLDYNQRTDSHWLAMNGMADLSRDEYRQLLGTRVPADRKTREAPPGDGAPESAPPASVDWRQHNAVTEVKNQASCGGCWAFSATGAIEGINAIYSGELLSLSEQELIDCELQDNGCNGGWMDDAFMFVERNRGITTETDYSYRAYDEQCDVVKEKHDYVTIDGYFDVPKSEEALLNATARQPVSVAIEADTRAFQLYGGGVFDAPCGTQLDHGVLVVGYNISEGMSNGYWIVKNSWGSTWGEQGYIRLGMGLNQGQGQCGIALACSYPLKTSPNPPGPTPPSPHPSPSPAPGPLPPPPPPPAVHCDSVTDCPAGTTCCCELMMVNICWQWGCCPYEDGTCCTDRVHCCPKNYPVCDINDGGCVNPMNMDDLIPWKSRTPATRHLPWISDSRGDPKEDSSPWPRSMGDHLATT